MSEVFNPTKNEIKISIVCLSKSHVYDSIAFSGFNIFNDFGIPKFSFLSKNFFPEPVEFETMQERKRVRKTSLKFLSNFNDPVSSVKSCFSLRFFQRLRIFPVVMFVFQSIINFYVWLFRHLDLEFCNLTLYQLSSAFE